MPSAIAREGVRLLPSGDTWGSVTPSSPSALIDGTSVLLAFSAAGDIHLARSGGAGFTLVSGDLDVPAIEAAITERTSAIIVNSPNNPTGRLLGPELVKAVAHAAPAAGASGGELSRISLAIQVITAKAAAVPTLIFDEVDAGIVGAVAEVVGRNLRSLGARRQILCVTHLPQVAAQAEHQWSVAKTTANGVTRSRVAVLDEPARVEEIARMLGGVEITATTRKHAAEMLRAAAR